MKCSKGKYKIEVNLIQQVKVQPSTMAYTPIDPSAMTPEIKELGKLVHFNMNSHYDKYHFGFNGAPSGDFSGMVSRILLDPTSRTNKQAVKKDMETFAQGHRVSPLWSVILRFSLENWENLMKYAATHPLLFDMMFYSSRSGTFENHSIFKCWMTQDKSHSYKIDKDDFISDSRITFKRAEIKVKKKDNEVVVVIRLLETGFYDVYPPSIPAAAAPGSTL